MSTCACIPGGISATSWYCRILVVVGKPKSSRSMAVDGLAWTAHMNTIKHMAEEIIFAELIYS